MPAPILSRKGTRIRFRQDIQLDLAAGEYTFEVGLATISKNDFDHRELYPHPLLESKVMPICMIPGLGPFSVFFRNKGKPIQLLHHGIADLPGKCEIRVI
jgi:lipopolysaccharide transport system ATP-binding protein